MVRKLSILLLFVLTLLLLTTTVAADEVHGYRLCAADYDGDGYPELEDDIFWSLISIQTSGGVGSIGEDECEGVSFPSLPGQFEDQDTVVSYFIPPSNNPSTYDPMDAMPWNHDCNNYDATVNPGISSSYEISAAVGYDLNCDGGYWYEVECRPDMDGDGFGNNDEGFTLILGYDIPAMGGPQPIRLSDDPVAACNTRDYIPVRNTWNSAFPTTISQQYPDSTLAVIDPYGDILYEDAFDTQNSCQAASFDWVNNPPAGYCEGAIDCNENGFGLGCTVPAAYCEGSFDCSDLSAFTCEDVAGCSLSAPGSTTCVDDIEERSQVAMDLAELSEFNPLYDDTEFFFDCDRWFAETDGTCRIDAPAQCVTDNSGEWSGGDEAPSCSVINSEGTCNSYADVGCEWVEPFGSSVSNECVGGSFTCGTLDVNECPLSGGVCELQSTTSCSWDNAALSTTSDAQFCWNEQLWHAGGNIYTDNGQAGGTSGTQYVGCTEAGYNAGCIPVPVSGTSLTGGAYSWAYGGGSATLVVSGSTLGSETFQSYTGFNLPSNLNSGQQLGCVASTNPTYTPQPSNFPDYMSGYTWCSNVNSGCSSLPMCQTNNGADYCAGGGASCSEIQSDSQCSNVPGCSWEQTTSNNGYLCAQRYAMIPSVVEPRIDCDDMNASQQLCPDDDDDGNSTVSISINCLADYDLDGFYSVVGNVTGKNEQCSEGYREDLFWSIIPFDAANIPGWDEATYGGQIYDADDDDARETYVDCPAGEYFVYPEGGLVTNSAVNDYPRDMNAPSYNPKYFGGCCAGDECLRGTVGDIDVQVAENNDAYCRTPSTLWTKSGEDPDGTVLCSPGFDALASYPYFIISGEENKWLDADTHPLVCEVLGHEWLTAGHTITQSRIDAGVSFTTPPGEYDLSKTKLECCGDDNNERTVNIACDGSTTTASLCAPDDGQDYRISNGDLVLADACPDITRAPPAFVRIQGNTPAEIEATMNLWDSNLEDENLYCCTADRIGDANYPLCQSPTSEPDEFLNGCFISESTFDYSLDPAPSVEWCVAQGEDPNCVIDGEYLAPYTETSCEPDVFSTNLLASTGVLTEIDGVALPNSGYPRKVISKGFIADSVYELTHETLDTSCDIADTTNCEVSTITICNPIFDEDSGTEIETQNGPSTACVSLCEEQSSTSGLDNCKLLCASYTCEEHEVYHGAYCEIEDSCVEEVTQIVAFDAIPAFAPQGGMNPFVFKDDLVGPFQGFCQGMTLDGSPFCPFSTPVFANSDLRFVEADPAEVEAAVNNAGEFLMETILYEQVEEPAEEFCQTITITPEAGTQYCVPNGHTAQMNLGPVVCMDDENTQNFGDYWCPNGFEYNTEYGFCVVEEALCASGQAGTVACADITTVENDGYFNQYNANCVANEDVPGSLIAYDETCCLAATFNDFELYTTGNTQNNVRVY
jgi:hypothetical protein